MKSNLVSAILFIIAMFCFLITAILYAISGHWLLVAIYLTATSIDGINACLQFKMWLRMRRLMKEVSELEKI